MFGLGHTELILIMVALILLFGARKIPELGRGLGKGLRGFKDALSGVDETKHDLAKAGDVEPTTAPPRA